LTNTDEWTTFFKNSVLIEQVIRKRAFTNMRLVRNDNASIAAYNKIADELTALMKGRSGTAALNYNYKWRSKTTFKGLLLQKSHKPLTPLPARQLLLGVIRDTLGRRTHRRGEVHLNTDILWSRLFRHVWERLNRAGSLKGPLLALGKPANSITTILAQAPFISPEYVPTGCSDMLVMSRTRCPTTTCLKLAWQLLTKAIEAHIPLEIIFKSKTKQPGQKPRLKLHPSIHRLVVDADAQRQLEALPQIKKDCDTLDSIPSTAWDAAGDLVRNEDNPAILDLLQDMRQVGVLPLHDLGTESTYFIMALSVLVRCPDSSTIYAFPFRTIADTDVSATMGVMFCGKKELKPAPLEYIWSVSEIVFNEYIEDLYVEAESYIDRLKPRHDKPTVAKWQNRQPIEKLQTFQDNDDSPVVLIVAAADIENQALLELSGLSNEQTVNRSFPVGNQSCVDLGFQKFAVWATLCAPSSEVVLGSQATVGDLIATISTKRRVAAVIMPGIAFGLKQDEQRIGDILLSTQIRLYDEPAKKAEGGHELPRPIVPEADSYLVRAFRMSTPNWQKKTPNEDLRPRVHAGLFLSGRKLVNDPHMVFKLKQNARHAIGGEMVGAGVYSSAARKQTPWIIVKSICDWGMHKGDNYQLDAARNSADFVYHVLATRSFSTLVNKSHYSSDIPDKRNKVKQKKEDDPTMTQNTADRRFRIALSFSGDERSYVEKVADHLAKHFGEERVFYDQNYRPELARVNLDTYLQDIYHKDSDLVALFFSDSYNKKGWCGLEWRAIRDLITTRPDHIIPIKMSASVLPKGLFPVDGYLVADELDPIDIAKDIIKRYAIEFLQSASIP